MSTNPNSYSMRVFWSEGDAGFIAVCPELDVSAFGGTYEKAVRELEIVIGLSLEVYAADGETPPAPATSKTYSGQLRVRLPRSLHARLADEADAEGVSLNTLIVSRLSAISRVDASSITHSLYDKRKSVADVYVPLLTTSFSENRLLKGTPGFGQLRHQRLLQPSPCATTWPDTTVGRPLKARSIPEEKQQDAKKLVA